MNIKLWFKVNVTRQCKSVCIVHEYLLRRRSWLIAAVVGFHCDVVGGEACGAAYGRGQLRSPARTCGRGNVVGLR